MIYKLITLPTPETLGLLSRMFAGTSMHVDWDAVSLTLASDVEPILPAEDGLYRALPGSMDLWYDTAQNRSFLVLPLVPSPEMAKRHEEAGGDAWGRKFVPFLNLGTPGTNRRRHSAQWKSIATGLIDRQPILTFHGELVLATDGTVPELNDFYTDYLRRGSVSNEVLFKEDEGTE